jgi:hypothetical protein
LAVLGPRRLQVQLRPTLSRVRTHAVTALCILRCNLEASDGRVGLTVGDGVSQLFVYPARARSSGEFTQAVIQVSEVRAAVEEMRGRGKEFEAYDTPETRTENGIARTPDGGEGAWFKDSEGNLVGVAGALPG